MLKTPVAGIWSRRILSRPATAAALEVREQVHCIRGAHQLRAAQQFHAFDEDVPELALLGDDDVATPNVSIAGAIVAVLAAMKT